MKIHNDPNMFGRIPDPPERKECCGNCKHYVNQDGEWVCLNNKSDYFTDYPEYSDYCEEWEGEE